jgi:hypothetical protein
MKNKEVKTNWGTVIIDLAVMVLSVSVSVWQDNPNYLWLLILLLFTGKETSGDYS